MCTLNYTGLSNPFCPSYLWNRVTSYLNLVQEIVQCCQSFKYNRVDQLRRGGEEKGFNKRPFNARRVLPLKMDKIFYLFRWNLSFSFVDWHWDVKALLSWQSLSGYIQDPSNDNILLFYFPILENQDRHDKKIGLVRDIYVTTLPIL